MAKVKKLVDDAAIDIEAWLSGNAEVARKFKEVEVLYEVVRAAEQPDAPLRTGDHCRWCPAKPLCPAIGGQLERAVATKVRAIDPEKLSAALVFADMAEDWAKSVRDMAEEMLKNNVAIPGWKMVPKRPTRQWADVEKAKAHLGQMGLDAKDLMVMKSPAQVEKIAGKLPKELFIAVSSGNTIAPWSDPRPAVLTVGADIRRAVAKLK